MLIDKSNDFLMVFVFKNNKNKAQKINYDKWQSENFSFRQTEKRHIERGSEREGGRWREGNEMRIDCSKNSNEMS